MIRCCPSPTTRWLVNADHAAGKSQWYAVTLTNFARHQDLARQASLRKNGRCQPCSWPTGWPPDFPATGGRTTHGPIADSANNPMIHFGIGNHQSWQYTIHAHPFWSANNDAAFVCLSICLCRYLPEILSIFLLVDQL